MGIDRSMSALLAGTVTIAMLHALIPSHWLAFAVVGRRQRWTTQRTLAVTALAGTGHVLLTVVLGLVLVGVGKTALQNIPPFVEHAMTACLLILLGGYFVWASLRGGEHGGHSHGHNFTDEDGTAAHGGVSGRIVRNPTVIGALVLGMTLSPCLDLLSVYVAAAARPWHVLMLISLLMALITIGLMVALVWLTLRGLQRLNLHWLEHNEGLAIGGLLILLGVLLFFL